MYIQKVISKKTGYFNGAEMFKLELRGRRGEGACMGAFYCLNHGPNNYKDTPLNVVFTGV